MLILKNYTWKIIISFNQIDRRIWLYIFKFKLKNIRNAVSLYFEANYLKNIDKNIFNAITRYNFLAALLLLNKKN